MSSVIVFRVGGHKGRLEQRMSKHQDACRIREERKSAVAEHAWKGTTQSYGRRSQHI